MMVAPVPTRAQAAEATQRRIAVLRSLYRERGQGPDDLERRRDLWAQIQEEEAHLALLLGSGVARL